MSFELAESVLQNLSDFKVRQNILKFEPVNELIRVTNQIGRELREIEEEQANRCGYSIWRLKTSTIHTLRPFDCPSLALGNQVESVASKIGYFPHLVEQFEKVQQIIDFLIANPANPKRETVFDLLNTIRSGGRGAGFVSKFSRIPTPAWSPLLEDEIKQIVPHIELISSKEKLKSRCFTQIILTAGIPRSDLLPFLYLGYRTKVLDLVAYEKENLSSPSTMKLPPGNKIRIKSVQIPKERPRPEADPSDVISEDWINREFWSHMRSKAAHTVDGETSKRDQQFRILSRLVILGAERKVFLRDDQRILEISGMIDGDENIEDVGKRLPRRMVSQLREGDLIVLRTSGSGEYLVEVADTLLAKDGKGSLRATALDWKKILENALFDHGSSLIATRLQTRGHEIRDHNYIGVWTTDIVMKPESKSRFDALLSVIHELGYSLDDDNPEAVADSRWNQMLEIQSYHFKAGNLIRQLLLTEIRKLVKKDVQIGSHHTLTLPGADAGEMTIFRISGVDSETIELPYTRVGIILPLEE